ncbi:MAG: sulfatase [Planctomycetota bacterium]|nr:sulfatase [Planctomycetota bacterium]
MHAFVPRGIASLQVTGFVLIAASLSPLFAADDSKTPPRNVVIFITDDQSPDLGCYGNTAIKTPHMDALATEGVRFPYAFCTTASCSASRSVVLTGLHNHANGHYGHQHSYHKFSSFPWVQSLPVILSRAGYRTARIGKHHNAPEEVYYFETKLPGSSRSPVEMAENCREWIEQSGEQPFFLYFATADPHRSGNIAEDLPYRPNRFGNKPNSESYPFVEEILYEPADVIVPPFLPETQSTRAELAQYYQSISRIDQGLGRLVQILKETGQWDQTLFLFTSDHGMAFAGAKTTVYEGGLRVPFILRNPDMKQQGTRRWSVSSTSFRPFSIGPGCSRVKLKPLNLI